MSDMNVSEKSTPSSVGRLHMRGQVMEALVAHVVNHREWVVPQRLSHDELNPFPNPDAGCVRNRLIALAEEGDVTKVVARELPESLIIRPPSSLDLSKASFGGSPGQPTPRTWEVPNSPLAHFMPSPNYLKALLAQKPDGNPAVAWLLAESLRICSELQRPDVRITVKTNVSSLSTAAKEALTDKVMQMNHFRHTVRREDVHGVVCMVMHKYTGTFPLSSQQEREFIRQAQISIERREHDEVRRELRTLRAPAWRI